MRSYVRWRGRVWLDTGMRDYRGYPVLWSLTRNGEGVTPPAREVHVVAGTELEACERIWGRLT